MLPTIFKTNWIIQNAINEAEITHRQAKSRLRELEEALPVARRRLQTAEEALERLKKA